MERPEILFDSRNTSYKRPLGAVTADTQLVFNILISEDLSADGICLIVKYDRHQEPAYYPMERCGGSDPADPEMPEGYARFTHTMDIHDTGLYWYHFRVNRGDEHFFVGRDELNRPVFTDNPSSWQQTVYRRAYHTPDWIYGGIYYHVFVDRFHSSGRPRIPMEHKIIREDWGGTPSWEPSEKGKIYNNDFFGGDLEGIRQKLPYLAELGTTCIYLSPIFEAYSNHKYDTSNYELVDPMFGTNQDFSNLCREASDLGIRVICDGVFSHTGSDSKYFDKYGHYGSVGAYEDPGSTYRSWYYFRDDGSYESWWDFDTLPRLNKEEPAYVDYITGDDGIVRKWLRAGASGWRLDVADELPVSFLDKLVACAKAEKDDAIIIGEVWEDASCKEAYSERKNYFEGNRLDSVMNYPFRNAIIGLVRGGDAEHMAETVESIVEHYPEEVLHSLMNLLGTHDSPRIITALAGEDLGPDPTRQAQFETKLDQEGWAKGIHMLKMASLIQMTLPGVPCIYYGDEAGTEGYKDPFNRTCYPWGHENRELLDWYKKITTLRRDRKVFERGSYRTVAASRGMYSFVRGSGDEQVLVAVNCGTEPSLLDLTGCGAHGSAGWRDLLTDRVYSGSVDLDPGHMLFLEMSL